MPTIFTRSKDRITSADATDGPRSICPFSNGPSRGREETSACHGSSGHLEGGVLTQAALPPCTYLQKSKKHTRGNNADDGQCSKCNATQIRSIEALKCGDVWPEPSVSVATLHPPPHLAIQNKQGSFWMCVSSVCHQTERWNRSLGV